MAATSLTRADSSPLAHAKILAIVPLGEAALRSPELLREGLYVEAMRETVVASIICLIIASAYRIADWIMTTDRLEVSN